MTGKIEARLQELGIELPAVATPAANYIPFVVSGNLVFVSGQITILNGEIKYTGRVGVDVSVEEGYQAARLCGLNLAISTKYFASSSWAASSIPPRISKISRKSLTARPT